MDTMQKVVLIAHTFIALAIIALVLLQRGKGADAGAAFGSGASGTVFGARGSSNFFSRTTAILATIFFASSLTLAYMSSQRVKSGPSSLIERAPVVQPADDADGARPEGSTDTELPPLEADDAPDAGSDDPAGTELPALEPADEGGEDDTEGSP